MKINHLFMSLALLLSLTACNKDNLIEEDQLMAPRITLDNEEGIYTVKIGRSLTIAPTFEYVDNALFSWTIDGSLVSTEKTLTMTWTEPGEVFVELRVQNENGKAEEELRVDVVALAPPVISLTMPANGLKVVQNTDYIFTPDIQNSDLDGFTCEWLRDGQKVGEGVTYTFNESTLGTYILVCHATNSDGEATREIPIQVVDEMPYVVEFPQQSYLFTSTDRYAYIGTPILLEPRVKYFDNPQFTWSVDGVEVAEDTRLFKYTPTAAGVHVVRVSVAEANVTTRQLTRNITRSGTTLNAQVNVTCIDATQQTNFRASTAGSSPTWNKVYEYTPAAGQFVGEKLSGGFDGTELTSDAAIAYAEKRMSLETWVSLGAFGGYLVVGFDHSIPKRAMAENEYDFAIQGNAFDGSSEPGIIWVMQDINQNGLPDDEWYELRGSETGAAGTIQNYAVTYFRPAGVGMDVQWTDSEGKSGCVDYLATYHQQDSYYPTWVEEDSYTLYGTRLRPNNRQDPNTGFWYNMTYDWGYADNFSAIDVLGGNSHDGSGQTNGFKISNAIYADGTPVDLQYVDFIKVQTGVQVKSGWLGEVSTEVFTFTDLSIPKE